MSEVGVFGPKRVSGGVQVGVAWDNRIVRSEGGRR